MNTGSDFQCFWAIVFTVAQKISREMSPSAIQNLSENLDLIQCTIEAILRGEAEFQTLIAQEIARAEDLEKYIRAYEKKRTVSKISLILSGRTQGVSNNGEPFTAEGLDFSAGGTITGLPGGAWVDECMASFDRLQDAALNQS